LVGKDRAKHIVDLALGQGRKVLTEVESKEILEGYGVSIPRQVFVPYSTEKLPVKLLQAVEEIGFPVVLKIVSPHILHKTEVRGVKLGITSLQELQAAYQEILINTQTFASQAEIQGVLIQEMISQGREVLIGARRDPVFGPFILFGLGGIWVEIFQDTTLRASPLSREEARAMIDEIRGSPLLKGYRGESPLDLESLVETLLKVSRLVEDLEEIQEMDLNPVLVRESGKGSLALDARIILSRPRGTGDRAWTGVSRDSGQKALDALLNPRSIAVIGASRNPGSVGERLFTNLLRHGFQGRLYPVNPKETHLQGLSCYPSIREVPEPVDLACLVVPAGAIPGILQECGEKGIKSAIVYASGYAEAGDAGEALQRNLLEAARKAGIRFCGPNAMGIVNTAAHVFANFSMALQTDSIPPGEIAFITQSGALGGSLLSRLLEQGVGFSYFIASGNEADLETADYLEYLTQDPHTRTIVLFLEGVQDGPKFQRAGRKALEAGKPVVVFKNGRTELGGMVVKSHTGVLAGNDRVYEAIFKKLGMIRVYQVMDLFDVALALTWQPLPQGKRIGIVSTSGGACSLMVDACIEAGLEVPQLSGEVINKIQQIIPPFGSAQNPVDVTAQVLAHPNLYQQTLQAVLEDPHIDGIIVLLTTLREPIASELARGIVEAVRQNREKPILVVWTIAKSLAQQGIAYLMNHRIPVYSVPETGVKAMKALVQYKQFVKQ
jgi:acetyl coenzyme A synthetase (ADP forming)-like protein